MAKAAVIHVLQLVSRIKQCLLFHAFEINLLQIKIIIRRIIVKILRFMSFSNLALVFNISWSFSVLYSEYISWNGTIIDR